MKICNLILHAMLALILITLGSSQICRADDPDDRSYFDLSLEELMDITIVTASSFDQKVSEAIAIIDVYTGEQITNLGVDNLYEFLSFLPGIEIMETYYGYTDVQFRGILQAHYNNKSSLLLNGQPLFDEIISSYYLEQIPISAIEQIEVVRGPGGVLYGTNAYAGVINIITKDGKSMNGSSIKFKGGSFGTKRISVAIGREIDGLDLFIGTELNESNGYKKTVLWDEDDSVAAAGNSGEQPYGSRTLGYYPDDQDCYENDYVNFYTSLGYRDFIINAVIFESSKDKFGIIPTIVSTGERLVRGFSINARYSKPLFENKAVFKGIIWYDQIEKDERVNAYQPVVRASGVPHDQEYSGHKGGFQAQMSYNYNENLNVLGGIGFEDSHADPYVWLYTDSLSTDGDQIQDIAANAFPDSKYTNDFWSFIQTSLKPLDKLSIQAGGRYNNNRQAGSIFNPSLGAVYSLYDNLAVKFLYGAGFRNPSFFEKYVHTIDVLAGDIALEPERINTYELGIDYRCCKYSLRVNGFYTTTDKLIERRPLTASEVDELNALPEYGEGSMIWSKGFIYYNNIGGKYHGIELSMQGKPMASLNLQGNFTYKAGEDDEGNDLQYFAPFHANIMARYSPITQFNVTLTMQYVAERKGNYYSQSAWQTWPDAESGGTDYTLDAYTILNARVSVKPLAPIEFSIIVKNILDKEYYYPEYIRRSIPFIPGGPERSFYLEVGYQM